MQQEEFKQKFQAFQRELKSYLLRISGNQEDAEDLAQETYIKIDKNLKKFKGESSFKTWAFTVATNLARDHFRSKQRWSVNCQDNARKDAYENPEMMSKLHQVSNNSPAGKFEIKEHIDFCFTCMGKTLPIEQQIAIILKDIYGFKVLEIVQIINSSEGKVKHALAHARKTLVDIFENRCALIHKKGACYQCSEMNGILNPKQKDQEELMLKHMAEIPLGAEKTEMLYDLRLKLIRSIDPLNAKGTDLHNYFLELMPDYSKDSNRSPNLKVKVEE